MKNIIIVESPAKCKTISKYLGEDYTVVSSKGHIRDLATSGKYGLGIDIENDFKPSYEIIKGKKKDVKYLKDLIEKDGGTSMTCQHCGKKYDFSKEELNAILHKISQ